MELEARLATESHPATRDRWILTPEACRQAAEQLPGTLVTANYDAARPLGRVVSAEADGEGVRVTMELDEVPPGLRTDEVGPGFVRLGAVSVPDEVPERVTDLDVREVALLPKEPGALRSVVLGFVGFFWPPALPDGAEHLFGRLRWLGLALGLAAVAVWGYVLATL